MARILLIEFVSNHNEISTIWEFSNVLSMLTIVAATLSIMAIAIFNCGHKRHDPNRKNNVVYGGGGIPSNPNPHGHVKKNNKHAGDGAGLAAGVLFEEALSDGGEGEGDGESSSSSNNAGCWDDEGNVDDGSSNSGGDDDGGGGGGCGGDDGGDGGGSGD